MKIVLDLNSAFLVHVKRIDTDSLTEEEQQQQQEEKEEEEEETVPAMTLMTSDDAENAPYLPIKNNETI
jgi:hypothetical protein